MLGAPLDAQMHIVLAGLRSEMHTKLGTGKHGIPPRLRVVADLRERNKNCRKLTSPLPDMEGILRRLARKPYRSLVDGKDAYEQIRVEPDHIDRTKPDEPHIRSLPRSLYGRVS